MKRRKTNIGWAETDITPDRPVMLFGQMYQRVSRYIKDPLMGTALVMENEKEQAIMISLDIAMPPETIMSDVRIRLSNISGLNTEKITIFTTHTHNAYDFGIPKLFPHEIIISKNIQANIPVPPDVIYHEEGNAFLIDKIVYLVKTAWQNRQPCSISYASDYAVVGFNRRPVFQLQNGSEEAVMYGVASKKNFRRFEGTVDHSAEMLFTWDENGLLTGVLLNISCPSQVYELHSFISSDYWHDVRGLLKEKLGHIFVLPLCGAAGDQSPLDLVRISKSNERELKIWNEQVTEVDRNIDMKQECIQISERICEAVLRGFRRASGRRQEDFILKHQVKIIEFPIRQVGEHEVLEAEKTVRNYIRQFSPENKMQVYDMVKMFEPCGIIQRWKQQQQSKIVRFTLHIIRIGDTAIVTNPFELFVEYGLRIKARSKSNQTMIIQLADACGGYLPSETAIKNGAYSSKPASTLCGPDAGDILCETLISAIDELFP